MIHLQHRVIHSVWKKKKEKQLFLFCQHIAAWKQNGFIKKKKIDLLRNKQVVWTIRKQGTSRRKWMCTRNDGKVQVSMLPYDEKDMKLGH